MEYSNNFVIHNDKGIIRINQTVEIECSKCIELYVTALKIIIIVV